MLEEMLEKAKQTLIDNGYHIGTAWIDEEVNMAYVGSVESVPNTYGHPRAEISYSGNTGWYRGTSDKFNFETKEVIA